MPLVAARTAQELNGNCTTAYCTSPGQSCLADGNILSSCPTDCWAGTKIEPCSCSQGTPKLTGTQKESSIFVSYEYVCCMGNVSDEGDFACGAYQPPSTYQYHFVTAAFFCLLCAIGLCIVKRWERYFWRFTFRSGFADFANETSLFPSVDGSSLHREVPPENWCVTLEDLKQFERIVKQKIREGNVTPTEWDPFIVTDLAIGPCIHTVCEQVIKPVTHAAGDPSWALMLHPQGLKCDVFFTHSWNEGVFEFLSKAIASWPSGADNAYVCFLSNPQNLDIGDLVVTPRQSPFARALESARYMVAVPNRKRSIYTRVWCTYEAFLALSWGKHIFVALPPIQDLWTRIYYQVGLTMGGVAVGLYTFAAAASDSIGPWPYLVAMRPMRASSLSLAGVIFYFCLRDRHGSFLLQMVINMLGVYSGFLCAHCAAIAFISTRHDFVAIAFLLFFLPWSSFMEIDRLHHERASRGVKQLCSGFKGHIRQAASSYQSDKDAILAEIDEHGVEEAVDEAVSVLVTSGISTPHLRRAVSVAGDLRNADVWNWFDVFFWRYGSVLRTLWVTVLDISCNSVVVWLRPCVETIWLIVFAQLSRDKKAFAAAVSWLSLFATLADSFFGDFCAGFYILSFLVGPIELTLSVLGPAGAACVPVLGPPLVRLVAGRQKGHFWHRPPRHFSSTKSHVWRKPLRHLTISADDVELRGFQENEGIRNQ